MATFAVPTWYIDTAPRLNGWVSMSGVCSFAIHRIWNHGTGSADMMAGSSLEGTLGGMCLYKERSKMTTTPTTTTAWVCYKLQVVSERISTVWSCLHLTHFAVFIF